MFVAHVQNMDEKRKLKDVYLSHRYMNMIIVVISCNELFNCNRNIWLGYLC